MLFSIYIQPGVHTSSGMYSTTKTHAPDGLGREARGDPPTV
jgi:hypothetical protein